MAVHKNRKGLNLPISGAPEPGLDNAPQPRHVALLGGDYVGMKPTMHVALGDHVSRGQLVFEDKKTPGVRFTAPAEGKVVAINRGDKRAFQSLVIELSPAELGGSAGAQPRYSSYTGGSVESLTGEQVRDLLLESGSWPALRARPYGRVANPETRPKSIFVTAIDTSPLAPAMNPILESHPDELRAGLLALAKLTEGTVHVCVAAGTRLDLPADEAIQRQEFAGPHPAGTPGWHIHCLDPVDRSKVVWYLGVQDVIAIGQLVRTGEVNVERIVSLAGPGVQRPRLLRTRIGASTADLVKGEVEPDSELRVISGSVLSGRTAAGDVHGFLGRYHQQISVIGEYREREFLGWMMPGMNKFSVVSTFVSKLMPGKKFPLNTSTNGSPRAIVPIGVYEKVFPFDIQPTALLRSIAVHDVEKAEQLGALELEEEDLGLCSFVDPGKSEFGRHLRQVLTTLEKEG